MRNRLRWTRFYALLLLWAISFPSCTSLDLKTSAFYGNYDIPKAPEQTLPQASNNPPLSGREITSTDSLITYCPKETAPAATPEEKKWRDAFSFEVMERICKKEPQIAKRRIDYYDWNRSRYLETSWVNGINLTGVQHGWPRGTAITPRHLIYTNHYAFHGQVGDTIFFLTMDNRLVTRKIVAVKYIDNVDLAVARLESDLPGSITPFKVLDPEAAKLVPDLVPVLRIEQQSKALIVMKKGENFWPPGEHFGTKLVNPPELAYAQYYQPMIRFDSSSPSILLLRNEYGVMPILYGLVTWGGTGNGPLLHQHLAAIQSTIEAFGDSHRLEKAMPPLTGFSAPSCSIDVRRLNDGQSCEVIVTGSADPVTGVPVVTPSAPNSWENQKNVWKGKVICSSDPNTIFEATLTGPGGQGRACESRALGPVVPQCKISVSRRGATQVCDVAVTKLLGSPNTSVSKTSFSSSDWEQSGDTWRGTTSCPLNEMTQFSAILSDEMGQGLECSTPLEVYSEVPTCEISSRRVGYDDTCEISVFRKSGVLSGSPVLSPEPADNWAQAGDEYKTNVPCSAEGQFTFSAQLSGPLGLGPVCKSPTILSVPVEVPFCDLKATRRGLTQVCELLISHARGWVVGEPPVAAPYNPAKWEKQGNTLSYAGNTSCPLNTPTQFNAFYPGLDHLPGRVCRAPIIDRIPPPACNLQVVRQNLSNRCNYSLSSNSVTGTIASYHFTGGTSRSPWNGSNPVQGQFTCSQTSPSTLTAYVWGPGVNSQRGICSFQVPRLASPSCIIEAKRRAKTAICDITLFGYGINNTVPPKLNPAANGRWSGNIWRGTSVCSRNVQTQYTATVYGPKGATASCVSTPVPNS